MLKFIYSEKAPKFCDIFTLLLSYVLPVKSKVKISPNFVAFLEHMNFKTHKYFTFNGAKLSISQDLIFLLRCCLKYVGLAAHEERMVSLATISHLRMPEIVLSSKQALLE